MRLSWAIVLVCLPSCALVSGLSGYDVVDDEASAAPDGGLAGDGSTGGPDLPDGSTGPLDGGGDAPSEGGADAGDAAGPPDAAPPDAGAGCGGALACERTIFVTSTEHTGNLGGLLGGDALCQARADASNEPTVKGKVFRAWLSTGAESAAMRHPHGTMAYKRVDGSVVATSWVDLVDGAVMASIRRTELGTLIDEDDGVRVWTGTRRMGEASGDHCNGWTASSGATGLVGDATETSSAWTEDTKPPCQSTQRLYCIEY